MKRTALYILGAVALLLIAFGGVLWNMWSARKAGPEALGRIPDFSVPAATADGPTTLSLADLKGSIWVAQFVFTHCSGPCPLMSSKMSRFQTVLPPSVRLVSFTVDPERDSLEVLTDYAHQFEADPKRWIFARAEKPTLYKLVFEGFKLPMMEDPQAESGYRVIHSQKFTLVDGQGRIRGYFDSNDEDIETQLLKAVRRLEAESR